MIRLCAVSWDPGFAVAAYWWANFRGAADYIREDQLVVELEKWGATWINEGSDGAYLDFEDEKDATAFMLRWS